MAGSALQAEKILENMVQFIKQHGEEEVARIQKSTKDEFTIEKNQYLDEQKKIISENYKIELANEEVKMKIE